MRRGAALTDPGAGVLVCLIGEDGSSVLRRVTPLADPAADAEEVMRICGGDDIPPPGANCSAALDNAARRSVSNNNNNFVTRRFQEGSVDEVSFLGPEVGPLAAVIVAPEAGTWRCDELDVSSSRSGNTARFVCRDDVGDRGAHAAAFLRPVPPGGVVYGSGDASVVLTKEQASQLREWNLQTYSDFKATLLGVTAALVAVGTGVTYSTAGPDLAVPFALGGLSSLVYQYLLQRRVDGITASAAAVEPARASEVQTGPGLTLSLALSNPAVRALLIAGGLLGSLVLIHIVGVAENSGGDFSISSAELSNNGLVASATAAEVRRAAAGLAGFLMQKIAIMGVSAMPDKTPQTAFGSMQQSKQGQVDDRE